MRTTTFFCLLSVMLLNVSAAIAQKGEKVKVKFGKVSPEDFKPTAYSIDSSASAVVIAEVGTSEFSGNTKGWFSLEFKRYRRVHILNKNGYDASNVTIPLYSSGDDEEALENVRAVTYNLVDGKVVETKLDAKKNIFKEKLSKKTVLKKFTLPDVKEGSIIEFEYKIKSDFLHNLQPWEFQGEYPVLWSEYNVSIPQFFGYVFLSQGYHSATKTEENSNEHFSVTLSNTAGATERSSFSAGVTTHRWVMKNIPVLKEESFTSTLDNHVAKLEFQLSEFKDPLSYRKIMGTWPELTKEMLAAEYFGAGLKKGNNWLGDEIDPVIKGATSDLEKARRIFKHVQKNYTCTRQSGLTLDQNLKTIVKSHKGTVSELNLLLTAMLRYADLLADPVILSTRSHGYAYAMYPLIERFNYVVTQVELDKKMLYLDASLSRLGFGRLAVDCYNGHARVIDESATPIDFLSDSLAERKLTSVFIINGKDGGMEGSMQQTPGYYESYSIRNTVRDEGKDKVFANYSKSFGSEIDISEPVIDSLDLYEEPVLVKYNFTFKNDNEDVIYLNPLFSEALKVNPFKAAERYYPVEMPYTLDQTFLLRMDVPKGYKIDEMPKQMVVKLNEYDDGIFEYRISESAGVISLRSRLKISRSYFMPEEYEMLREFFNLVVKKHSEQIVFKKL